jgi:hypothetical protein
LHPSTRPMAENESGSRIVDGMQMSAGESVRCCDLHAEDV